MGKWFHADLHTIPSACPLCAAVEDMYHRLKACTGLTLHGLESSLQGLPRTFLVYGTGIALVENGTSVVELQVHGSVSDARTGLQGILHSQLAK